MDPVTNMLGLCEVCGENEATTTAMIPLWEYGVRKVKSRSVCGRCLSAHKKGIL